MAPPITSRPKPCGSSARRSIPLGVTPDGLNINDDCGSTHPELLQETVVASGADIGLALDGDADRLIVADEKGQLVDGDQLMALIALGLQARGELKGGAVVATVMSNLGLERKLGDAGLKLVRTKVGDRYVLEEMRKSGCNVGGEQSGHIILADHATTGDGLVAGLQVLAALVEAKVPASQLLRQFEPLPQLLKNVRFNGGSEPLEADSVRKRIAAAEAELEGRGRLRHPQIGHRAADPGDGRRRRSGAGRAGRRRHLRGRSVRRVNAFLVIAGATTISCAWKTSPRRRDEGGFGDEDRPDPDHRRLRLGRRRGDSGRYQDGRPCSAAMR